MNLWTTGQSQRTVSETHYLTLAELNGGIGAVDLPTYFLDLTPFVPLLTDGQPHLFTIDVASAEDDHTILQNWFVSGVLQVFVDSSSERTIGNISTYSVQPFAQSSASASVKGNDVVITVNASRQIHIEADFVSGSGISTHVVWTQDLQYQNIQSYLNRADTQVFMCHLPFIVPSSEKLSLLRTSSK